VLTASGGSGEKPQATEVLRALLDPEGMEGRERDEFLNLFYEEFVDKVYMYTCVYILCICFLFIYVYIYICMCIIYSLNATSS